VGGRRILCRIENDVSSYTMGTMMTVRLAAKTERLVERIAGRRK
jgi:hypothetical protein